MPLPLVSPQEWVRTQNLKAGRTRCAECGGKVNPSLRYEEYADEAGVVSYYCNECSEY